jgi:hypothetical protein
MQKVRRQDLRSVRRRQIRRLRAIEISMNDRLIAGIIANDKVGSGAKEAAVSYERGRRKRDGTTVLRNLDGGRAPIGAVRTPTIS